MSKRVRVKFPRWTTFRHPEMAGWVVFPDVPYTEFARMLARRGWTVQVTDV